MMENPQLLEAGCQGRNPLCRDTRRRASFELSEYSDNPELSENLRAPRRQYLSENPELRELRELQPNVSYFLFNIDETL